MHALSVMEGAASGTYLRRTSIHVQLVKETT
jgi:hypothetical protein